MFPQVKFFRPRDIFLTGLGLRRKGADWQYYLPFLSIGERPETDGSFAASHVTTPHVKFALPVSESRVFVATHYGDLAMIDLIADQVVVRAKIKCTPDVIQMNADRRHLFVQDTYSLFVLDATTMEVVQYWHQIERSSDGWARYIAAESDDVQKQKIGAGTLERLNLIEPVREVGGGKLGGSFMKRGRDAYGPESRSGFYMFDIATGAIERNKDMKFQAVANRSLLSLGPTYAQEVPSYLPEGSAEFEALVAREAMVRIVVADHSRDAAISAIGDIAGQMERDIQALICCESINLHFVLDGKTLDAGEFFSHFVQEHWIEAGSTLRRLMLAYLNNIGGGEGDMPWHYSGQSQCALRALVLLDADAHDVYRLYLQKGDLEHDHGPYKLYAEYLDRHGVRNEADVRFGIYLTIMGCLDTDTDPSALLKGAERHVTPARFADIVIEEAKHRGDDFWDNYGEEYVKCLCRCDTTFTHNVLQALTLWD